MPRVCSRYLQAAQNTKNHQVNKHKVLHRDAQYVDFGSVQRTVRVQYAVRCLVRCLYAAVKGTCNVLVKVSLEVTY
jgi:hypothetical protein